VINKHTLPAWNWILIAVITLLAVIVSGFVVWGLSPSKPMLEAWNSLKSDQAVIVSSGNWLAFSPCASQPTIGFIFYPGGHVDFRAYAPPAHQIAAQGYLVVIVPEPLNLAVLNPSAAADVITAYPHILHWIIGGHSLGGAMAASFVHDHPDVVEGLVLWASYPASSADLSSSRVHVLSIFGSLDGLFTQSKIEASRALLPHDTRFIQVDGGNHAQFGYYGIQPGDHAASITREE
jgi:hypothetical protein